MTTKVDTWSGEKIFPAAGCRYFKLLETQNPVDVEFRRADGSRVGFLSQVEAGTRYELGDKDAPFAQVVITTASTETVKLFVSDGRGGNDAVAVHRERSVKFAASGSYVVPAGVTLVRATIIGGGGGGGGGHNVAAGGGGGGGGSGAAYVLVFAVTPGETLTVTVGAGGAGGAAGSNGTSASQSTINRGSTQIINGVQGTAGAKGTATNGGNGGVCAVGGAPGPFILGGPTGTGDGAPGQVWRGVFNRDVSAILGGGGGGAGGGPSSTGGNGGSVFMFEISPGGANAGTDGGGGGGGRSGIARCGGGGAGNVAGTSAVGAGSGGGGGGCQKAGGNGADGLVIIEVV